MLEHPVTPCFDPLQAMLVLTGSSWQRATPGTTVREPVFHPLDNQNGVKSGFGMFCPQHSAPIIFGAGGGGGGEMDGSPIQHCNVYTPFNVWLWSQAIKLGLNLYILCMAYQMSRAGARSATAVLLQYLDIPFN